MSKIFKLRKIADILTIIIVTILLLLLPIYIISVYKTNHDLSVKVNNIQLLFHKLDAAHYYNAELLFESLEFRRIEYHCYLSKESPHFIAKMNRTLENYIKYVMNDPNLTIREKKELVQDVEVIEQAVAARIDLTTKLVEYDKKRELYFNQIMGSTVEKDKRFSILNKKVILN